MGNFLTNTWNYTTKTWDFFSEEKTVTCIGTIVAILNCIKFDEHFFENPLSVLSGAFLNGIIYGACSNIVSTQIHKQIRPFVSFSLIASAIYYKWNNTTFTLL